MASSPAPPVFVADIKGDVSSFGPLLLAKVLGLNDTQTSMLSLVFKYCDDNGLLLLDFPDLRAVPQNLTGEGVGELRDYGAMSQTTVGVPLREMIQLEQQGAEAFFGQPEFDPPGRPARQRAGARRPPPRRPRAGMRPSRPPARPSRSSNRR